MKMFNVGDKVRCPAGVGQIYAIYGGTQYVVEVNARLTGRFGEKELTAVC